MTKEEKIEKLEEENSILNMQISSLRAELKWYKDGMEKLLTALSFISRRL